MKSSQLLKLRFKKLGHLYFLNQALPTLMITTKNMRPWGDIKHASFDYT